MFPSTHNRSKDLLQLQDFERRFLEFVEVVHDYAICMLDAHGRIATWNIRAQRMTGYSADEIIGRHFSCFYPDEDISAGKPEKVLQLAESEGRMEDEGWRIRKDG